MKGFKYQAARILLCIGVVAGAAVPIATASADSVFRHSDPPVTCRTYINAYSNVIGRRIFVGPDSTPTMWVAGSTQWWLASWQPVLYRYDPASRDFTIREGVGPELRGYTNSTQGWDYVTGRPDWNGWFNVSAGYSYRLAIVYRWYANGSVYHSEFLWAGTHTADLMAFTPDWYIAAPGIQMYSSDYFCTMPNIRP